jgi:hypothetical protein
MPNLEAHVNTKKMGTIDYEKLQKVIITLREQNIIIANLSAEPSDKKYLTREDKIKLNAGFEKVFRGYGELLDISDTQTPPKVKLNI